MEIKIELPGNVKVSCPSAHCAITILRCVSYRAEHASQVAGDAPRSAKSVNPLGWQTVGSGLDGRGDAWVSAADVSRDEDDYSVEDAEFEERVVAAQVMNRDEGVVLSTDVRQENVTGGGFPHIPYEGPGEDDEDIESEEDFEDEEFETQGILPAMEQEPTSLEEDEDLFGERTRCAPPPQVRITRSRMSASLFSGREEEDDESMFQGKGTIYQPIEHRLGDRAKAVFDFIQDRRVFSTEDIRKYAAEELKLEINKKNKKKLRKALKVIKRAGLIEKTGKGEWKMVG